MHWILRRGNKRGVVMGLLEVKNLSVSFKVADGRVYAVSDLSFSLQKGKCLAIVGESGSGKSVTALTIMRILEANASVDGGHIFLEGRDILKMKEKEMQGIRGKQISMIFQDPMTALNPSYTVYNQIAELYKLHGRYKKDTRHGIIELLGRLHIPEPEAILKKYPFELSGGMCQRIIIAMAFALKPDIIIADEPTTALDVSTQAEILKLLKEMSEDTGSSVLLITHDMGVVAEMADEVMTMYRGKKVEEKAVEEFFRNPEHPYTKELLKARPENFNGRFYTLTDIDSLIQEESCIAQGRTGYTDEREFSGGGK